MTKKRKSNSNDVAKLAGVSQASVSRAFSPNGSISASKKEKILQAAKQLHYVPNAMARALISNQSNCIAIIQPISKNPYFYSKVLQELLELLRKENQRAFVFSQDDKDIDDILPLIDQYQVDGVILASANIDARLINEYVNRGIEFSFINRNVPNVYASSICTDNKKATKDLVSYLANKGYKKLACIAGDSKASTAIDRVEGFVQQINELNLENLGISYCDFNIDSGYGAALSLIKGNKNLPEVIVCGNDEIAIGVINAINENTDLKIPEDIAVTGFDNIEVANWPGYQLTTIEQPIKKLCQITVNDLLDRIRNQELKPVHHAIQGTLIARNSA